MFFLHFFPTIICVFIFFVFSICVYIYIYLLSLSLFLFLLLFPRFVRFHSSTRLLFEGSFCWFFIEPPKTSRYETKLRDVPGLLRNGKFRVPIRNIFFYNVPQLLDNLSAPF